MKLYYVCVIVGQAKVMNVHKDKNHLVIEYRSSPTYVAPQLPDLPSPTDKFSENSDSENELR